MNNSVNESYDVIVIGGGPAGMTAAINAKKFGASVLIVDENDELGGQLVKQTHKFFGSKMHYAGYRGFEIGNILKEELVELEVDVLKNAVVWHIEDDEVFISFNDTSSNIKFKKIIIATGAKERPIFFPGWTLPGVLFVGALQTLVNLYRVSPGKSAVIIGSGNVGLIVSYQLIQAGIEVKAVIEKTNKIGGYRVHENKIKKLGVPIFLSAEIKSALGDKYVEGIEIISNGKTKTINTDIICIAAGMLSQNILLRTADINLVYSETYNDYLPIFNDEQILLENKNFIVAGDVCGVEEASIAIEEGRLAGLSCCEHLGLLDQKYNDLIFEIQKRLSELRDAR